MRLVGARFSRMSMAGVGCILLSAVAFSVFYIGSLKGFYGTAYGVMVGAKAAMFVALLLLGLGNFLVVERLRRDPATLGPPSAPLRRSRDRHRHHDLLRGPRRSPAFRPPST